MHLKMIYLFWHVYTVLTVDSFHYYWRGGKVFFFKERGEYIGWVFFWIFLKNDRYLSKPGKFYFPYITHQLIALTKKEIVSVIQWILIPRPFKIKRKKIPNSLKEW
jgi:hypothetical protein